MAGRWRQQTAPEALSRRPYLMYDAVVDGKTRPTHRAMDERVYPADHPVWVEWYPPNGHRCRCNTVALSADEVRSRGLTVLTDLEETADVDGRVLPLVPDPGWAVNVGEAGGYRADLSKLNDSWVRTLAADATAPQLLRPFDRGELLKRDVLLGEVVDARRLMTARNDHSIDRGRVVATASLTRDMEFSRSARAKGVWPGPDAVVGELERVRLAGERGPLLDAYLRGVDAQARYLSERLGTSEEAALWAAYEGEVERVRMDLELLRDRRVEAPDAAAVGAARARLQQLQEELDRE